MLDSPLKADAIPAGEALPMEILTANARFGRTRTDYVALN